jgi:hypothetical protein
MKSSRFIQGRLIAKETTQGRTFLATMGFKLESRCDSSFEFPKHIGFGT